MELTSLPRSIWTGFKDIFYIIWTVPTLTVEARELKLFPLKMTCLQFQDTNKPMSCRYAAVQVVFIGTSAKITLPCALVHGRKHRIF
jgi:hypothetical protein